MERSLPTKTSIQPWITEFGRVLPSLPSLDREQFMAIMRVLAVWFQIKAAHEGRWTDEQRACLRQLDPDVWHSALLWRMLAEKRPPLPEPPPLEHAYPVYPKDEKDAIRRRAEEYIDQAIAMGGTPVSPERREAAIAKVEAYSRKLSEALDD